jgi:hypothetical protein
VLLYSEHTWGAYCSITEPERDLTRDQWEIKRGYALGADRKSRELLAAAFADRPAAPSGSGATAQIDIYNTVSWLRTALALVPANLSTAGDRVTDDSGRPVPSQRLASGELALLARDVPPFAARRYTLSRGEPHVESKATVAGNLLESGAVRVRLDETSGGIVELTAAAIDGNFADTSGTEAINDYLYLPGDDLKDLRRSGPVTLRIGEKGPLVASLLIDSDAPGCKRLHREVRVVAGLDHVELFNLVDKARLEAADYRAKEGKESVNFAFPFNVPDGRVTIDVPLGLVRVEADQMPSACKNWLTVGRFADVTSEQRGITWVTLDAPLVQVGGITARLLNSQTDPKRLANDG